MAHPFVSDSYLAHQSGRQVLDASAGPAVSCLGFGRPEIAQVVTNQINQLAYLYSGARFTCDAIEDLASTLLNGRPGGLCKVILVNSGSEATDAAIKPATQYWFERGMHQKSLCISGHDSRRAMYRPWLPQNVSFVDPCFSYRLRGDESDEEYVKRLAGQLEEEILRIMCGMGKTGTMHAWEQEGISGPDIQMIGKALGGGFIPLSGVLFRRKIFDAIAEGSGGLAHGHTFQAHSVACAAALQVQRIIPDEDILTNVQKMGIVLENLLKTHIGSLGHVGDVRGRGLFWAVEFVQDRQSKTPFPASLGLCHRIVDKSLDLGLNILGNLGQTGEVHVDHVIISPPYVVTESELERMVGILREAILNVVSEISEIQEAKF
ncbi:pyridoxal phosphate-dependent transferase [Fusarium flagelliforme]|uniref:pyridoxal phosphate-dependent transferase n=1 Tax=Fusarium flagelliforme TaxID=2675880 RepID=UPI001E8D0CA2|nr:pyridoxal phosphate-dependent transferase [Fusarium flagelliforme]KAH7182790.1 pyridoxal phosphate-dependent transferase [Fusarium flagelliforme]